jgi:hypothetical protein
MIRMQMMADPAAAETTLIPALAPVDRAPEFPPLLGLPERVGKVNCVACIVLVLVNVSVVVIVVVAIVVLVASRKTLEITVVVPDTKH